MAQQFRGLEPHLLRERLFPPAASAPRFPLSHFLAAKAADPADRNQFPLETCIECRRNLRTRDRFDPHFEGLRSLALLLPRRQVEGTAT